MSQNKDFINKVKDGAISGWKKHKILPSISIAQAILESDWGRSKLAVEGNNLFGIKGDYKGNSITIKTNEWDGSKMIQVDAKFRKYPSWNESIEDHGTFFTSTPWRANNYKNVIGETDYKKTAKALSDAGYATDPAYSSKLINIVESHDLTKYDKEAGVKVATSTVKKNKYRIAIDIGHGSNTFPSNGKGYTKTEKGMPSILLTQSLQLN